MSILKSFFKKSFEENQKRNIVINWLELNSIKQLNEIEEASRSKIIGIFKHSTRCGISRSVLKRFEEQFPENSKVQMYYLDLLSYRDLSNEVGYKFQVLHQSPQLLIIQNKEVILHASHYDITQVDLEQFVK